MVGLASHIRAGEIIARRVDPLSFTYEFTFIGYRDNDTGIEFGNGIFDFGDGATLDGSETNLVSEDSVLADNIIRQIFRFRHTYSAPRDYIVSYAENYRNAGIANMENSSTTRFYVETLIVIDPFVGINNSPILTVPPIDEAAPGARFIHNPGAFDPDGDSIRYVYEFIDANGERQIIVPKQNRDLEVFNYRELDDGVFYTDVFSGSEAGNRAFLTMDEDVGDLIWDSPGDGGTTSEFKLFGQDCPDGVEECFEYNVAFRIEEYRQLPGEARPTRIGYIIRDMQIIVYEGDNEPPVLSVPEEECVTAGETVTATILGSDPDGHRVKLEAFGGPFQINSPATVRPDPAIFQQEPGAIEFNWNTVCGHVRARPYEIQFKVTDDPVESGIKVGPSLVEFQTWQVTVVGPQPTGLQAAPETGRSVQLNWDSYSCPNASAMQVWRRVGDLTIDPDECIVGMPPNTGYQLIQTVPIDQLSTIDPGLAPGAKYCYRLVAEFPEPGRGESYVSEETCITLIGDAPVITNVSVEETNLQGRISVAWLPPIEIDEAQFPPPYSYQLLRSSGDDLSVPEVIVDRQTSTSFVDVDVNTLQSQYSYQVVLFDANGLLIDSSAVASSVRANTKSLIGAIEVSWRANVPWSNITDVAPYHYIYRDNVFTNDPGRLELIDSVNVSEIGFVYFDDGRFNNVALDEDLEYCYYVTTFGSYGNPLIAEPLVNDSQIICDQPNDNEAPCPPINLIVSNQFDCESVVADFGCGTVNFENEFEWEQEFDNICDDDAQYYRIYFSLSGLEEDYILLDSTDQLFYVHTGLSSFKGCYQITAVDRSFNESERSEPLCIDNCPNYTLPNVFTPNGDGYNDTFTPLYSNTSNPIDNFDNSNCPRFVNSVDFKVFDRNGVLVFDLSEEEEQSVLINWDGKTNSGKELPADVYYYLAEVEFDVLATSKSLRTFNGWVQILK